MTSSENTTTLLFYSTLFVSCCQLSPSCRCATLQVRPLRRNATDQLRLALRSGTARITRRCAAIICAHLRFCEVTPTPPPANQAGWWVLMHKKCEKFCFFVIQAWDYLKAPCFWPLTRRRLVDAAFPQHHYKFQLQVSLSLIWTDLFYVSVLLSFTPFITTAPEKYKQAVVSVLWK